MPHVGAAAAARQRCRQPAAGAAARRGSVLPRCAAAARSRRRCPAAHLPAAPLPAAPQLKELKQELSGLRVAKVTGGAPNKLSKM